MMTTLTRRGLFGVFAALPFIRRPRRYGSMDVHRWHDEGHFGKRVFCNGVDITDDCRWFDDELGVAECFTPDRAFDRATREPVIRRLEGRIEVRG